MSDFEAPDVPQLQFQRTFSIFENFDLMDQPHVPIKIRRYKFIFRFGDGNRKAEPVPIPEKYTGVK